MREKISLRIVILFFLSLILLINCNKNEVDPGDDNPIELIPIDLVQFSQDHRGFNLLGKFDASWSNTGFTEEEFQIIQDLGFNFVRLPLDYRTYTKAGDWDVFLEDEVQEIDKALEWGKQYGVHLCINLHRAPGYCVNATTLPSNQNLDLWTDPIAQEAFVKHWAYFAERYKHVSHEELSFNLVNEPGNMDETSYVQVMEKAIDKIHEINPNRIVFVDGLNYARDLLFSLKNRRNVMQAIHVYDPFTLTHYRASWVNGSDTWPVPVWPVQNISNYLYGPWKNEFQASLVFEGDFQMDGEIIINVNQVSVESTLQILLDEVEILNKKFVCGPDLGEDWTLINETQWGYQNISNKDYGATFPSRGGKLTISNISGDWMTMNRITIRAGSQEIAIIPGNTSWGSLQETYKITSEGEITGADGSPVLALGDLMDKFDQAEMENIPLMVQEFGVHNLTPHDVTVAYLADVVDIFNSYNIGYTLWNLSGSFGIIDSGRGDCNYTSYQGRQLDEQMTNLLQGD